MIFFENFNHKNNSTHLMIYHFRETGRVSVFIPKLSLCDSEVENEAMYKNIGKLQ